MAETKLKAILEAEDRASGTIKKFESSLGQVKSGLSRLQPLMLAAGAATGILTWQAKKAFEEFKEAELVTTKLTTTMQTHLKATDSEIGAVEKLANALQMQTRFTDENIKMAQASLVQYGLNQKQLLETTPIILDMAEALARTSGEQANAEITAEKFGRLLLGQTKGFKELGVALTEEDEKLFQAMSTTERYGFIIEKVKNQTNGLAVAMGDTAAGKIQRLNNSISEIREQIGGMIAKELTPIIEKTVQWLSKQENMNKIIDTARIIIFTFIEVLRTLKAIFDAITGVLSEIIFKFMQLIDVAARAGSAIKSGFSKAVGWLPGFQSGGIVPGAVGQPQMAVVHGGETITPFGKGTGGGGAVTINVNNPVVRSDSDINKLANTIAEILGRQQQLFRLGAR